jgi:hypothetical protein
MIGMHRSPPRQPVSQVVSESQGLAESVVCVLVQGQESGEFLGLAVGLDASEEGGLVLRLVHGPDVSLVVGLDATLDVGLVVSFVIGEADDLQ